MNSNYYSYCLRRPIYIFQGIAECATACGAKVTEKKASYDLQSINFICQVFRRGEENAGDSASSISAVQEFLTAHKEVDILCLIQVTEHLIPPI